MKMRVIRWPVTIFALGIGLTPVAMAQQPAPKDAPANAVGADSNWGTKVAADKTETSAPTLDPAQTEAVKKVTAYFNELTSLKGSFIQTGSDAKRMKGKFYLKRPGRFRFDYALPSKQVIISDGVYLAIQDLDLNNEDRLALDQTPFRLLLRKDVDLIRDAKISGVQTANNLIELSVEDKDPEAPGRIKLFLSTSPSIEIKEWITTDAQGQDTRVEVADITRGEEMDAALFKIQPVGMLQNMP